MKTWKNMSRLLAGKGAGWMSASLFSTLVLSLNEYAMALVLMLFLFSLKLIDASQIPRWLPATVVSLSFPSILAIMLAVGVLRALCQLVSQQTSHALLELVRSRLNLIQGYIMLILERERSISLSRVNTLMNEHFPKASDYVYHFSRLALDLIFGLVMAMGMLFLAWRETLVALCCLSLVGLAVFLLNRIIKRVAAHVPEQRESLERTLVRICRNWLLIRIMRLKNLEYKNYVDSVLKYFFFSRNAFFYRNLAGGMPPMMGIFSLVIVLYISLNYFHTPAAKLVGFIYLLIGFTRNIVTVTDRVGTLSQYRIQFVESMKLLSSLSGPELADSLRPEKILTLFGKEKLADAFPRESGPEYPPSRPRRPSSPPRILLNNVTFSWPDAPRNLFQNLSLSIPAGSRFAIVGPNGSGKSTLLGIILGILKPDSGQVLIDDLDASDYIARHPSVGYVGEDNFLIHGSIRENLLYGIRCNISDEDIWRVLKMVRLEERIGGIPGGWDSVILESADGFSSGEKQRLALARAFLRSPSILVLDEASSSLDEASETELAEILKEMEGRCTTIIVSHKPGILKGVDRILRLDNLAENGGAEV